MSASAAPPVLSIQVGMGWQLEQAGGLNRVFHELMSRLPGEGVAVRGLVAGGAQVERESRGAVRSFAAAKAPIPLRLLAVRRAVRALLPREGRVVLVSHFAPYGLGLLGLSRHLPLVVYFHGPWSAESHAEGRGWFSTRLRHAIERLVYRRADRCIVLSRAFAQLLERDFGVAPDRITVIPGGVDTQRFAELPERAQARRTLGWDAQAPTVLTVRRLVRRTGVDRLVAAVPALRARVPGVRVVIAGEGPERAALEAQARALGVSDAVQFVGFVNEAQLPLAYRAANVTVVPSTSLEGFGLIVPESLAAGTPALVTPVGGLPETVERLSSALVLRDASPASIATGLADALTGKLALPSADACAAFAREHHDWTVVAHRVAALLTEVAR